MQAFYYGVFARRIVSRHLFFFLHTSQPVWWVFNDFFVSGFELKSMVLAFNVPNFTNSSTVIRISLDRLEAAVRDHPILPMRLLDKGDP